MKNRFEELGGKVFESMSVEKIILKDDKTAGILLEDGAEVDADYIICDCDTDVTFGTLLPKSYMQPLMKEMYDDRRTYPVYGMFQVAFTVSDVSNKELGKGLNISESIVLNILFDKNNKELVKIIKV